MQQVEYQNVLTSVSAALSEFNQSQPPDQQIAATPETVLLGTGSLIDSLGLVNLLVTVEQQVSSDFGKPITLASDKAFSMRNSPFANVGSLATYITSLLDEETNG